MLMTKMEQVLLLKDNLGRFLSRHRKNHLSRFLQLLHLDLMTKMELVLLQNLSRLS